MRLICLILTLGLALATTACGSSNKKGPRPIQPNPTFSMNMAQVPADWPLEDRDWALDPVAAERQQAVYGRLGKPDYFWLYWRRDEKPMTSLEFMASEWVNRDNKQARKNQPGPTIGWVYVDEAKVVKFGRGEPEEKDLPDTFRVISDYGDPQEIKESVDVTGAANVIYQYYDQGKIFYFRDGKKYKEESAPRMEGFFKRR